MHLSGSSEYSHCWPCRKVGAPDAPSLAAALEHTPAGRAELGHVGDQAGLDPFLVGDGLTAKPEGVALAGRPFFFCVALTRGRGSERDPTQNDPQRDQFPHRSAPVTAAFAANSHGRRPLYVA